MKTQVIMDIEEYEQLKDKAVLGGELKEDHGKMILAHRALMIDTLQGAGQVCIHGERPPSNIRLNGILQPERLWQVQHSCTTCVVKHLEDSYRQQICFEDKKM